MNFKVAAAVLLLPAVAVLGDNTPNLCTRDIGDLLRIAPSVTGVENIPNITVGGEEYNGDAEHFVINSGSKSAKSGVTVYLPGTTDRPELSSCLLKEVAKKNPHPVVGLSYAYLSSGDSFRNGKCLVLKDGDDISEQVNCLEQQHIDAIDGGDYGATHFTSNGTKKFWDLVHPSNSMSTRLVKLFGYMNTQEPHKGWDNLVMDGEPNWKKIIVMGHSQGAGHAAYLGHTRNVGGVSMISGPQDECQQCPPGSEFWIDGDYQTLYKYTMFGHFNEPLYEVMKDNWAKMSSANAFGPRRLMGGKGARSMKGSKKGSKKGSNSRHHPRPMIETDINFGVNENGYMYEACRGPLFSKIVYAATSTCGGKEHCSTAIDDSVPFIEKTDSEKKYLYDSTWVALSKPHTCKYY